MTYKYYLRKTVFHEVEFDYEDFYNWMMEQYTEIPESCLEEDLYEYIAHKFNIDYDEDYDGNWEEIGNIKEDFVEWVKMNIK